MSHIPRLLNAFSRMFTYPDEYTAQTSELLYVVLQGELPEAASEISTFGAFVEQHEHWEVEETFTETFDVNTTCALEVGWHLFGEEHARGMFLVRMREELRKYNLPESIELPDHLCHVLAVVAAMPEDAAARFVRACVQPAVEKMNQGFEGKDVPYAHVVAALSAVLKHTWGEFVNADDKRPFASQQSDGDPLRAYPVADVGCDCGSSCGENVHVVPLQIDQPAMATQPADAATQIEARRP